MVKRKTNFQQMFLADSNLTSQIQLQNQSLINRNKSITYIPSQNDSCTECRQSNINKPPFPEEIRDPNGNINTTFGSQISSSSSSSNDENNDNNYNALNQKKIKPLPNYSPQVSSSESDMENLENFQNSNVQRDFSPQINEQSRNDVNSTKADSTQEEMDIFNDESTNQSRQNDDLAQEEQFTAPLSEDDFRGINVSNINSSRRSYPKMKVKKLKRKIERKKEEYLQKVREKKMAANRDQVEYKIRKPDEDATVGEEQFTTPVPEEEFMDINIPMSSKKERKEVREKKMAANRDPIEYKIRKPDEDATLGEEQFTTPLPEEEFMDINIPISSKRERKEENEDFGNQLKRDRRVLPSRIRKQQERKKKLKLLKIKNQRLKQLYYENKNQILRNENLKKDDSLDENDEDISFLYADPKKEILKNDNQQTDDGISEHGSVDAKSNKTTSSSSTNNDKKQTMLDSKRPVIRLRKFAYGTLPEQENITKPQIRVAKFADQELIKDKRNLTKELQYLCELCKIQFPKYSSLKQHLQNNHEKKQYNVVFPDSGKYLAFARKVKHKDDGSKFFYQNFNSNNDVTTDLTSYWCSKCKKFFKNFQAMQAHLKYHENENVAAKRSITKERVTANKKKMFYGPY